jgi:hypothetical protein
MNKIISTINGSIWIGIGLCVGIVLSSDIDDSIHYTLNFVALVQLVALFAYVVVVIIKPRMNGKDAADDKRLLWASLAMICSVSLAVYGFYIYKTTFLPRGMIMATLVSLWEFMRAENLYSYDKKWKPILHNLLSKQFLYLLFASCLPIGILEGSKLLEKMLAVL